MQANASVVIHPGESGGAVFVVFARADDGTAMSHSWSLSQEQINLVAHGDPIELAGMASIHAGIIQAQLQEIMTREAARLHPIASALTSAALGAVASKAREIAGEY